MAFYLSGRRRGRAARGRDRRRDRDRDAHGRRARARRCWSAPGTAFVPGPGLPVAQRASAALLVVAVGLTLLRRRRPARHAARPSQPHARARQPHPRPPRPPAHPHHTHARDHARASAGTTPGPAGTRPSAAVDHAAVGITVRGQRTSTTTRDHARARPLARPRPRRTHTTTRTPHRPAEAHRRPAAGWSRWAWPAGCCPARRRCWCCSARSRSGTLVRGRPGGRLRPRHGGHPGRRRPAGDAAARAGRARLRSHPASRFAPLLRIAAVAHGGRGRAARPRRWPGAALGGTGLL